MMAEMFLGADGDGTDGSVSHGSGGVDTGGIDPASAAGWADTADATSDLDGDGVRESVVFDGAVLGGDAAGVLIVATDTDLDGTTDRLATVADDGEYGVWEFRRADDGTARWVRTDEGSLGGDESHRVPGK